MNTRAMSCVFGNILWLSWASLVRFQTHEHIMPPNDMVELGQLGLNRRNQAADEWVRLGLRGLRRWECDYICRVIDVTRWSLYTTVPQATAAEHTLRLSWHA